MKATANLTAEKYFAKKKKNKGHKKAALTVEIIKQVGESKEYGFGFWLKQLKRIEVLGGTESEVLSWLTKVEEFPDHFSKGAYLTNRFKQYHAILKGRCKEDRAKFETVFR